MIPFYIKRLGDTQHIARAVYDAELTPLAAILYDNYFALGRLDGVQI